MQEQGKYKIGEYTFQTFHEYRDGQEDVRKIECINKELNIQAVSYTHLTLPTIA